MFPIAPYICLYRIYVGWGQNTRSQKSAWDSLSLNSSIQVCWLCEATKGGEGDMHMAFTDRHPQAAWRATYLRTLPWVERPWFADLVGFQLDMVMGDLLHVFNLGTAKNVAACVLKIILQDTKIFTRGTIDERMADATASLKHYARQNKYQLRLKKLTKSKIKWQSKNSLNLAPQGRIAMLC